MTDTSTSAAEQDPTQTKAQAREAFLPVSEPIEARFFIDLDDEFQGLIQFIDAERDVRITMTPSQVLQAFQAFDQMYMAQQVAVIQADLRAIGEGLDVTEA